MRTNNFTYLHAHRPCSKWALFSRTQGWALLTQRVAGMTLPSRSRAVNLFTAVFRASRLKVLNARTAWKALGSFSFQQDGSTPYAGKKVAGCDFHWTKRGMHHASRALLHIFSYLECCFWWVAMQDVAKRSPSTIEGHMMVVNRFHVHINGQWHPSSTPHEKSSGLQTAASGTHFEHVL